MDGIGRTARGGCATESGTLPPLFWKCVKRKGFKSFVLKVCDSKGVADPFLRKCVKRKSLGAMWGLLGICDRYFGSLRSLRTTILVGWSFWPRLRFLGPFYGPCFSCSRARGSPGCGEVSRMGRRREGRGECRVVKSGSTERSSSFSRAYFTIRALKSQGIYISC